MANDGTPLVNPDASSGNEESVRLLIWDLDETFWLGTLSEGGITYRQDTHSIVIELARRGILSAICSKNDIEPVREILAAQGIWDYFIFPSIDWTPKGPRIRALVDAVQLRPETIVFIDDNSLNRAEAEYFVPGLRVFDEKVIPALLGDKLLRGKPDPELTRLRQYRLLQVRQAAFAQQGDTDAFLRDSNVKVSIDYNVDACLERAVELINRTNQLNFTKRRLPEDADAARASLRKQLQSGFVKAGLVSVADRYGDYGVCGFYLLHHRHGYAPRLMHFCFSCRILNMGVETWLYRLLGRPALDVVDPILTDVAGDTRDITWINASPGSGVDQSAAPRLGYVLLRGGCDIHTIAHYFGADAGRVVRELHEVRDGLEPSLSHSIMLKHAVDCVSQALREAARPFGFCDADFQSLVADPSSADGPAAWIFNFTHDNQTMLYRFRQTGELLPVRFYKSPHLTRSYIGQDADEIGAPKAVLDHLEAHFEFVGVVPDALFVDNLKSAFRRVPADVQVFVLLGNEVGANKQGKATPNPTMIRRNALVHEAAREFLNVETVSLAACLGLSRPMPLGTHYDRETYFLIYRYILGRLGAHFFNEQRVGNTVVP